VDTASKERRCQEYHTTFLPRHNVRPDLTADKLHYCFTSITAMAHVLPVNHHYIQRIVPATSPQSIDVGAWCKNYGQFPSVILEAIHVLPQINTSIVVKKGNGTQKEDKGKSMMHAL